MADNRDSFISSVLPFVAPGTPLREGLENVLRAKTGGLIVVGYSPEVMAIMEGGFFINCDFTPANLYELAKMDGAIILSDDRKKILYANTQLVPDSSIPSTETGMRHRTAERVAKQTGKLVVAISQRRNVITLYKGPFRYVLKEIGVILAKANQAIQTLEKYKSVLDHALTNLSALEFEELVTLQEVVTVLQRVAMVLRIKREIQKYIHELGTEGQLIQMQLEELVADVEHEALLIIKDYCQPPEASAGEILRALTELAPDEVVETSTLVRLLGYVPGGNIQEEPLFPRGYRILSKIPRLPQAVVHNLVERFGNLTDVMRASIEELDEVDGIGEVRARTIKDGLKRIQEQVFIDRNV